ncbi:MAG TPA: patatin-like phospholipase family protein [Flavipsychrobacter sp.]|nr:patatin-like phospholipase family protein [Flavipsychrobacter sp.]
MPQDSINIHDFLNKTNVESVIKDIETGLNNKPGGRPIYSDLYKQENGKTYEYVNYVQEGGGVLGVALVGYTYVLERLGFRFLKLAGTSAGAINTVLMAAVQPENYKDEKGNPKYQYQSEMILDEMLRFDFWKLVDGHWYAKHLIKIFIGKTTNYSVLKKFVSFCVLGAILYAVTLGMLRLYQFGFMQQFLASQAHTIFNIAGGTAMGVLGIQIVLEKINAKKKAAAQAAQTTFQPKERKQPPVIKQGFWLLVFFLAIPFLLHLIFHIGVIKLLMGHLSAGAMDIVRFAFHILGAMAVIGLVLTLAAFVYFKGRFARAGYGINPGDTFQRWMMDIMKRNHTETTDQLIAAMKKRIDDLSLQLRPDAGDPNRDTKINDPYLSMMASDVTLQTKAEFPLNAKDYWEDAGNVNPAEFVRASMSIPVFFSPHKVKVTQRIQNESRLWQQRATAEDKANGLAKEVWLVDGGVLSNFPINIFHNPQALVARMPTFGVKLEDEAHTHPDDEYQPAKIGFGTFLGNLFSTIRFYYDKDFLARNALYEKAIAHIDVEKINWLDFGMKEDMKVELFNRGAEAAKAFFLGGEYWVDGKKRNSKNAAPHDSIGKAFENGFDWEAFKKFRKAAILQDMNR